LREVGFVDLRQNPTSALIFWFKRINKNTIMEVIKMVFIRKQYLIILGLFFSCCQVMASFTLTKNEGVFFTTVTDLGTKVQNFVQIGEAQTVALTEPSALKIADALEVFRKSEENVVEVRLQKVYMQQPVFEYLKPRFIQASLLGKCAYGLGGLIIVSSVCYAGFALCRGVKNKLKKADERTNSVN
jgi:hypothetical protein